MESKESEIVEMHALFSGTVQGVGFRVSTCHIARELDIKGTVQNLLNGDVEVYAQGTMFQLDSLTSRLQSLFGEYIKHVDRSLYPPRQIYNGFKTKF